MWTTLKILNYDMSVEGYHFIIIAQLRMTTGQSKFDFEGCKVVRIDQILWIQITNWSVWSICEKIDAISLIQTAEIKFGVFIFQMLLATTQVYWINFSKTIQINISWICQTLKPFIMILEKGQKCQKLLLTQYQN